MSIELSEFYQTFFDEASEHLAEMESLLLELNIESPDLDQMNAIFRAAHSIKGGSGMFGFNEMVEVTHILETLLDKLRKGELPVTEEMVEAFLQAADILKGQIGARQGADPVEESTVKAICATLNQLSEGKPAAAKAESPANAAPAAASSSSAESYEIRFSREGNKLSLPASFDWLQDSLKDLGALEVVDAGIKDGQPAILKLSRSVTLEAIQEAFSFFLEPGEYQIDPSAAAVATAPAPAPVVEDQGFGLFTDDAPKTEADKAKQESDQGFGFFTEPTPVKAEAKMPAEPVEAVKEVSSGESIELFDTKAAAAPARKSEEKPAQKAAAATDTSIRVNIEKVDQLINLAGELVITQAMLAQTASEVDPVLHERLTNAIVLLERNTRDLQEAIMSIRMMPMSFVFSRFPRMVRDIANKLKKEINFRTQGEGTELDKGLIEKITDPLTHLVRNSLDHGIEAPDVRVQKGKDPKGNLILRAFHQGGNVVIEVQDDGGGLNRQKILSKAKERGLPVSDSMSDQDVWLLIFAPGFSTADQVTDVSGRGVGMDVVKKNIEGLGGRVEIESYEGLGTKMTIRLPLTLAILDGLSIAVGSETFIIPITSIIESLQPQPEDVKTVAGQGRVVHVRGEYLPLIALHDVFGVQPRNWEPEKGTLMIVEADGIKAALLVDELLGQHQVVIKSLESNYRKVPGISGATIMGDGRVALILDVTAVVRIGKSIPVSSPPPSVSDTVVGVLTVAKREENARVDARRTPAASAKEVSDDANLLTKLEDAVSVHTKWKVRLRKVLDGKGEKLDPAVVAKDHQCDLGRWIYGEGDKFAHLAEFRDLKAQHAKFHQCAGEILKKHNHGDKRGAEKMLEARGVFADTSGKTVKAIRKLQKAVEASALA